MIRAARRRTRLGLGAVLVAGVALVTWTYRDFGITWDEGVQARYGELALSYFLTGGADTRADRYLDTRFYGPPVEMLTALADGTGATDFELRHLVLGLLALLLLPAVASYARRLPARGTAPLALLALVTLPRLVGHACNNSKDVPFAASVAWLFVAAVALFADRRGPRPWPTAACGLALGWGAAVRPGGFPLLAGFLVAAAVLGLLVSPQPAGSGTPRWIARRTLALAAVLAAGWVLMVLPWPWAHGDPLRRPIEAMRQAAAFATNLPVLFAGRIYPSVALPRSYLPTYLLLSTPLPTLALAAAGAVWAVRDLLRRPRSRRACLGALALVWVGLPLASAVLLHPNVYDGLRHFLFVLPGLAVLAGSGGARLAAFAGRAATPRAARLAGLGAVVLLLLPVPDLLRLHPYETTYFNTLAGGLQGAAGRFETDYWAASYHEAMLWVDERAERQPLRRFTVLVAGDEYLRPAATYYAAPNVEVLMTRDVTGGRRPVTRFDFAVATTRFGLAERFFPGAPVLHLIGREGAVFTVIKGPPPP